MRYCNKKLHFRTIIVRQFYYFKYNHAVLCGLLFALLAACWKIFQTGGRASADCWNVAIAAGCVSSLIRQCKQKGGADMSEIFRMGCVAGFSGDRVDGPLPVVDTLIQKGDPSAIMFEVIGERTLALAQLARSRDPEQGYEPVLEDLLEPILAQCVAHHIPIIGNFGQANPMAAARCIARLAQRLHLPALSIGVVQGDDVASLDLTQFEVTDSDATLKVDPAKMITANVYLGAAPIVEALAKGAQIAVRERSPGHALLWT
jgi:hypothetical protein